MLIGSQWQSLVFVFQQLLSLHITTCLSKKKKKSLRIIKHAFHFSNLLSMHIACWKSQFLLFFSSFHSNIMLRLISIRYDICRFILLVWDA